MPFQLERLQGRGALPSVSEEELRVEAFEREGRRGMVAHLRAYKAFVESVYGAADKDEFHRIDHIARTLVMATLLTGMARSRGVHIDESVTYWSLAYHDLGSNHNDSPDHGDLGAEILSTTIFDNPLFTPGQAEHIIRIVRWHNKPHNIIPPEIWTDEFLIVTNADALDLVRMSEERQILLTTIDAWNLQTVAESVYRESLRGRSDNAFENVLLAFENVDIPPIAGE